MRIGLANIPFWAFPLTDEGWKRLEEMPLFQAFDDFSNNAPDSRWFPVADHREEMEYIVARLRKRGKRYRLVLLDRNWSLAEFVYDRWIAAVPSLDQDFRADSHPSDDGIRREVLTGIKRGDPEVWENAIRAAREVLSLGTGEYIVFNGAEGKDSIEYQHLPWDLRHKHGSRFFADAFEWMFQFRRSDVYTADFRHRYWVLRVDGNLYRRYHRTLPPRYRQSWNDLGTVYQETGVHTDLTGGDDVPWLDRQWRSFRRCADEYWWHGIVHLDVNEPDPVMAWSAETVGQLKYPKAREDYHGYLWGEHGREVEKWLLELKEW